MRASDDDAQWQQVKEEIRALLWRVAGSNETRTYTQLAEESGEFGPRSSRLHGMLDEICEETNLAHRLLITAVVVRAGKYGMPGNGFFATAERLGRHVGNRRTFWKSELQRVHDYACSHSAPD